ncbi:MAG: YraN family protein [Planctomycetota bacterium]
MPRSRKALGNAAERAALRFLKSSGYRPLTRNYSTPRGEIDIIAVDGDTVCFVEVRARRRDEFASPQATVNRRKQARIRAAASTYLARHGLQDRLCRFDLVSVLAGGRPDDDWQIELVRGAF